VSFADDSLTWVIDSASIVLTSHIVTGLSQGTSYNLRVRSRNVKGYSDYSAVIQIIAAQIPVSPTNMRNVPEITSGSQIGLAWDIPANDGGSEILDYAIWFDNATGETFFGAVFEQLAAEIVEL
jgi:hypothetical protein